MRPISPQHLQDYAELVELARNNNFVELRKILEESHEITQEDYFYTDIFYKSIIATISRDNPPYLTGNCYLLYEDGTWEEDVILGEPVSLQTLSLNEIIQLESEFERQVKEEGISFENIEDKDLLRMEFMEQYERFGIAEPSINIRL